MADTERPIPDVSHSSILEGDAASSRRHDFEVASSRRHDRDAASLREAIR
ncbi:hypothetical protein [Halorubrum trapanicum]|nr:hypothetical protein [Halorubrum trapanicum]